MVGSETYKLAVIGCGEMGFGLVKSLIASGTVYGKEDIIGADVDDSRRAALDELGVQTSRDAAEAVRRAENVLLAVKPQVLDAVLAALRPAIEGRLVISIAAGVPIAKYEAALGKDTAIVRVMPNILCTVGAASSAYCANESCSGDQVELVKALLDSVGVGVAVAEPLLDAVTGLSGSGPAFVALVIEALIDGGVLAGLPREQARELAVQTVLGTARWLQESGESPSALKDMVTSPGGTTIAGIRALEDGGVRAGLMAAVVAATKRSRELGA